MNVAGALEALLLLAAEPVTEFELAQAVGVPESVVAETLAELVAFYDETGRGFELRQVGGGWRYYTREEYADLITRYVVEGQQSKLSQAALETLAVVAYTQPISRARVSAVRGVNVDGVMRTLLARGLIEEAGHDPESGAVLFATTSYFLERMGLKTLEDLPPLAPQLPEVEELEAELGQLAEAAAGSGHSDPRPAEPDSEPVQRAAPVTEPAEGVRLQKVLAAAGIASRRACEVLISEGRVEVNSEVVLEQGRRVDPERDVIRVDGARIPPPRRHRYLALNKPRGVVATMDDPEGRRTVADLLAEPAGRRRRDRWCPLGQERAAVSRRSTGYRQRGFADLDQRRRLRPPAGTPLVPGAEDLRRRSSRRGGRADSEAIAARHHPRGRTGATHLGQDRFQRRRQDPSQDHDCRKVGIALCAVPWKRLAIRSAGCRGSESDRSGSGT